MQQRAITKNEHDDFVIQGSITIKDLYQLAKKEGFENRFLHFSIKNKTSNSLYFTKRIKTFGKGWTNNSAIINLDVEEETQKDTCQV